MRLTRCRRPLFAATNAVSSRPGTVATTEGEAAEPGVATTVGPDHDARHRCRGQREAARHR